MYNLLINLKYPAQFFKAKENEIFSNKKIQTDFDSKICSEMLIHYTERCDK